MFGKSFETRKEANDYLKKMRLKGDNVAEIRKMNKNLFPRRKKLYHVGSYVDFLNFA